MSKTNTKNRGEGSRRGRPLEGFDTNDTEREIRDALMVGRQEVIDRKSPSQDTPAKVVTPESFSEPLVNSNEPIPREAPPPGDDLASRADNQKALEEVVQKLVAETNMGEKAGTEEPILLTEDMVVDTRPRVKVVPKKQLSELEQLERNEQMFQNWRQNRKSSFGKNIEKLPTAVKLFIESIGQNIKELPSAVAGDIWAARSGIATVVSHPIQSLERVGRGAEQVKDYSKFFLDRNRSAQERVGKLRVDLSSLVEGYNKLDMRHKAYITGGLVLGSSAAAALSLPLLPSTFALGVYLQRGLGGLGFSVNRRKAMDSADHWMANKSETAKATYAVALAAAYTAGGFFAGRYVMRELTDWLKGSFGHAAPTSGGGTRGALEAAQTATPTHSPEAVPTHTPTPDASPTPTPTSSPTSSIELHATPTPAPPAVEHATAAVVMGEAMPEIPHVEIGASSHGYEMMAKQLWRQLKEHHIDPKTFSEHPGFQKSDLNQLLAADEKSINAVVHRLATEHKFFNPVSHESVQINPGAHLTIDSQGNLSFTDHSHHVVGAMQAPEHMHVTPPPGAQAHVEHPESWFAAHESPDYRASVTHPQPDIQADGDVTDSIARSAYRGDSPSHPAPVGPEHTPVGPESHAVSGHFPADARVEVNASGFAVDVAHANSYLDARGNHIIFGGDLNERATQAMKLIRQDHNAVVYFDSTRPGGFLGLRQVPHISRASWVPGENAISIVDDTQDATLQHWKLPTIDDLKSVYTIKK